MKDIKLVYLTPLIISILLILLFELYFFKSIGGLGLIEEYVVVMIIIPYLVKFIFLLRIGDLIDKENMGKYAYRVSKLQPLGLSMLSKKDVGILLSKHPIVKSWRFLVREINVLLAVHVFYIIYILLI